jgi:DNA-binding XRE family transcriptional regulator
VSVRKVDALVARGAVVMALPPPALRRALRQQAGLSQQELADALGVWRETVARWESGTRGPSGLHFYEYAQFLAQLAAARGRN